MTKLKGSIKAHSFYLLARKLTNEHIAQELGDWSTASDTDIMRAQCPTANNIGVAHGRDQLGGKERVGHTGERVGSCGGIGTPSRTEEKAPNLIDSGTAGRP